MTWKGEGKRSDKSRPHLKRSQSIAGITKRSRGKIDRHYRRSNPYITDRARILKRSNSITESTAPKKPLPVLTCGSQFRLMNTWNRQAMRRQQQQQQKRQQPPLRGWAISDMSSLLRETLNLQKSLQGHTENMNNSDNTSLAVDFDKAQDLSMPKVFRSKAEETMADDHAATKNDNGKLQDDNQNVSHQLAQRDETQVCTMNNDENSLPCSVSDISADKSNQLLCDITASSYFTASKENMQSCAKPLRFLGPANGYPSDPLHGKNNTIGHTPLTPCMPNQPPQVQMRSPSTFHDFQNQSLPGSILKSPTNSLKPKDIEMITSGAIQNQQKDNDSDENGDEINVEEYGLHTLEDDNLRNNLRIIWIPSFGDELYNTPQEDMNRVSAIWAVSSSDDLSVNADVFSSIIGSLRRRDTVILQDAENNRNNEDAGFADDENEDDNESLFDSLDRDLDFLRKRMLCREISRNSTDDFLSERLQTIQEADPANHQTFLTPNDFRNLLRQSSHFRCALCDTDLEMPPNGHVSFDPESGDLPSSVVLNNHREIDLYCPECDLMRYVSYYHGV